MKIDPERICRKAKLDRYYVSEETKTVYVTDMPRIADYLGHKLPKNAEGFEKYGYQWVKGGRVDGRQTENI